jgi:hypothetical protein
MFVNRINICPDLHKQVDFMTVFYQPAYGNGTCLELFEFNNLTQ